MNTLPERRSRRKTAKEKGLEPLAEEIYRQAPDCKPPMMLAAEYINPEKGVETAEDALTGAMDIIAEKNFRRRRHTQTYEICLPCARYAYRQGNHGGYRRLRNV